METTPPDLTFYQHLRNIADPRGAQGKQFPWDFLLTLLSAALATGQRRLSEIHAWVQAHGDELLAPWGQRVPRLPSYATLRRVVVQVDVQQVETAVAAHSQQLPDPGLASAPACPAEPGSALQGQALDGKTARGPLAHGEPRTDLVSLVRHRDGRVLAQARVPLLRREQTVVPQLLAGRDLTGVVITVDALHTHPALAQQILDQHGAYLMIVKRNQPQVWEAIDILFQSPPLPCDLEDRCQSRTVNKGHGRLEIRTLTASALLADYVNWPGAYWVLQRTCQRQILKTGRQSQEVTYAITSLDPTRASLARVEQLWRGHWTIENKVHYVRDVTFGEDTCPVHRGQAPHVLATLRNGVLNLLRQAGWHNIAAALRHYAASATQTLRLLGVGFS